MLSRSIPFLALLVFSAGLSTGCMQNYTVSMGDQPSATAHYVIVKTNWRGKMRVFDCQSQPEQGEWDPTCKQVKMQSAMGELVDDTLHRVQVGKE